MTKDVARDENDRHKAGLLPSSPDADASPMKSESAARQTALAMLGPTDDKTKPLPHDIDAELALISALLWCGTNAKNTFTPATVIDLLDRAEMLHLPAHRFIWAAMCALRHRGAPCDITAVHSELVRERRERKSGGMPYLEQLVAAALPVSELKLREHAEAIREVWMRRQLIETARALATEARDATGFATDIATQFATRLSEAAGHCARDASYVHVSSPLKRTLHKSRNPGTEIILTTGFPEVNRIMAGGLRMKRVTILGARTSVGKSALALEVAISAHEGAPDNGFLYISLEMDEEQFTDRMTASRARVEAEKINLGTVDDVEFARLVEVARKLKTEEMYFNVKQDLSLSQIRGVATRTRRELEAKKKRLGLIVIDHIGLVRPTSKKPSREQEVAEISRGLRVLADDMNCHVLALAQINRKSEEQTGKEKMPMVHHLRDSGAIEQDADTVWLLHRERAKDGRGFVENQAAKLGIAKGRSHKTGLVWLACEPKYVRFEPWETSEQNKARAPDPHRNPSRQYVDTQPDPDDDSDSAREYFNTRGL